MGKISPNPNLNASATVIIDPEKGIILTPEKAGDAAQAGTRTTTTLDYDVNGKVNVVGGQLFIAPDLNPTPEADSVVLGDMGKMATDVIKNSSPVNYSDQVSTEPLSTMQERGVPTEQSIKAKLTNAGLFTYLVADDAFFLDKRLYLLSNSINSEFYDDTEHDWDAAVIRMVNAGKNQYNARIRRTAKLAKAFKDSILAQTNDTNPFYEKHISEIFDRISDYFLNTNHVVTLIKTIEFWLSMREIINEGDKAYAPVYNALYTADFCVSLTKKLGSLKASAVGLYYDKISLAEYINNAVPCLVPRQNGAARIFVPLYGTNVKDIGALSYTESTEPGVLHHADPYLTHLLLPQISPFASDATNLIKRQQDRILNAIEVHINKIYSHDCALIATAFAAFNGVPALAPIKSSGIRVSRNIPLQLSNNIQMYRGDLSTYGRVNAYIKVRGVARAGITAADVNKAKIQRDDAYGVTSSMIVNYNGITSYVSANPSGDTTLTGDLEDAPKLTDAVAINADATHVGSSYHMHYGSSHNTKSKTVVSAAGLCNTAVYDHEDTKRRFDIYGAMKPEIKPFLRTGETVGITKDSEWANAKYKYVFAVHYEQYDSLCVANALLHNGDTIVVAPQSIQYPDADIAHSLLENRKCEGPSSVSACWEIAGVYAHQDDLSEQSWWGDANLVSTIDNACPILTQSTLYDLSDDEFDYGVDYPPTRLQGWVTNVTDGAYPLTKVTNVANDSTGDRIFFSSASQWGVLNIQYNEREMLESINQGFTGVNKATSPIIIMDFLDGTDTYMLSELKLTNYGKAQYMYGQSENAEENIN